MTLETDQQGVDLDVKNAAEGYQRFRAAFERDKAFYKALASNKQRPRLLWIGCSDSRVVPSQIVSADPGELFEIRNIANCVPPAGSGDASVGAAIEYAISHLGVDDVIVCGHTGCGGLEALHGAKPPLHEAHLASWVEQTRPAHSLVHAAGIDANGRSTATVAAHLQFQLDNLMTYDVIKRGVEAGRLGIHGWLYDMESGEVVVYDWGGGEWRDLLDMVGT